MIRLTVILLLMVMSSSTWAGYFSVKLDKQEVALGQMVTLTMDAENMKGNLESLDIKSLEGDFEIYNVSSSRYTETRGRQTILHQQMEVSLFPMHIGKIKVPSILFDGRKSHLVFLNVLASSASIPTVMIRSGIVAPKLYQRKESILYVDAYHDGTLQWRTPPKVTGSGFYLRPLPDSVRKETVGGVVYRIQRFAWAVTPLRFGTLAITFSHIEAGKFGERLRYAVPTIARDVTAIPSYLPVYLHVGKLSITSVVLPRTLETGRPVQWVMELRGKGLSVDGLRKFLVLPEGNHALFFYDPEIAITNASGSDPDTQVARITIPVKPLGSGATQLPGIRIPYFEPENSKLEAVVLPPRTITVVNPIWENVKIGFVFMGVLVFGVYLIKWTKPAFLNWVQRRRWIRSLEMASEPKEFYGILHKEGRRFFMEGREISRQQLNKLEQVCYGQEKYIDFNELKSEFIAAFRRKAIKSKPTYIYHKNVSILFNPPYP